MLVLLWQQLLVVCVIVTQSQGKVKESLKRTDGVWCRCDLTHSHKYTHNQHNRSTTLSTKHTTPHRNGINYLLDVDRTEATARM